MSASQGVHLAAFTSEYEAILAGARQVVADFPPLLREQAYYLWPRLVGGTFSQIAALLPYWVTDLVEERADGERLSLAARPERTQALGLANLLGWWAYLIQDWLLDRQADGVEALPLGMAFYAAGVRRFASLLPNNRDFWAAFESLSLTSAEAHLWEQRHRFQNLFAGEGPDMAEGSDLEDLDRLADRSALLPLAGLAQLSFHGHRPNGPLGAALAFALRQYAIARQIADDRTDWIEDLRNGRPNYVSARIARRMKDSGAVVHYAELDPEWMVGHFLYDDELFADIQSVALAAAHEAVCSLAPYDPLYLGALVDGLIADTERVYAAAVVARRRLRALFSPAASPHKGKDVANLAVL